MLFLLQESTASTYSPGGLERLSNGFCKFFNSSSSCVSQVASSFAMADGWLVRSVSADQWDDGSHLIPKKWSSTCKMPLLFCFFRWRRSLLRGWNLQLHLSLFLTSDVPCWVPDVISRANIVLRDSGSNGPFDRFHYIVSGLPRLCIMCVFPDALTLFSVSIYAGIAPHLLCKYKLICLYFYQVFWARMAPYTTILILWIF